MIEQTLSRFDGIWFLRHETPRCITMNQKTCRSSFGNLESGAEQLTRRDREMIRRASGNERYSLKSQKDIAYNKKYKTCAVVGNAPNLIKDKYVVCLFLLSLSLSSHSL